MPSSNYAAFDVKVDGQDGTETPVPSATLKTWNRTSDTTLAATVVTDANGHVPAGTLPVAAGTVVSFRLEHDGHGRSAYTEVITS
jgi:hypothetical protein